MVVYMKLIVKVLLYQIIRKIYLVCQIMQIMRWKWLIEAISIFPVDYFLHFISLPNFLTLSYILNVKSKVGDMIGSLVSIYALEGIFICCWSSQI